MPSTITTDRGRQFESRLWSKLLQLLGCKHLRTTAYHPIANGIIERFHRQLKSALKAHSSSSHWIETLPLVLLGIRTALKTDLQCSAAELVYGRTQHLPGEFFLQDTSPAIGDSSNVTHYPQNRHAHTKSCSTQSDVTAIHIRPQTSFDLRPCLCPHRRSPQTS